MESFFQINFTEHFAASNGVGEVTEVGKAVAVKLSPVIQTPIVPCRAEGAVSFWREMQRRNPIIWFGGIHSFHNSQPDQLVPGSLGLDSFFAAR